MLSAAAARTLLELDPPRTELVRLAVEELVVRRARRLEPRPAGRLRREVLHLVPGHPRPDDPTPLPLVEADLRDADRSLRHRELGAAWRTSGGDGLGGLDAAFDGGGGGGDGGGGGAS